MIKWKLINAQKLLIIFGVIAFPALFYNAEIGLNCLLFQLPFMAYYVYKLNYKPLLLALWIISLAGILFYGNMLNLTINLLVLLSVLGSLNTEFKALNNWSAAIIKIYNFFIISPDKAYPKFAPFPLQKVNYLAKTLLIPALIFMFFLFLYSSAINGLNTIFLIPLKDWIKKMFSDFNFIWVIYSIIGGLFSYIFIFEPKLNYIKHWFEENLNRKKGYSSKALTFIKSTKITFIGLNFILVLTIISQYFDFYTLLTNVNSYEDVKTMVHQSTYFILIALSIGIILVGIFFKGQILFFNKKKALTQSTKIWIGLNAILALNLLFINSYYIYHYNLAYKRVGIILFIIILIYSLYQLIVLLDYRKTISFLANSTLKFSLIICMFASLLNWDYLIAKWNLSRPQAYLDMNFLVTRNYSSLKILLDRPDLIDKPINPYDINYWAEIKSKGQEIITYRNYINYRISKMNQSDWRSFCIFPK